MGDVNPDVGTTSKADTQEETRFENEAKDGDLSEFGKAGSTSSLLDAVSVYDIFVSYSSDSSDVPREFETVLRQNHPDLTVYCDGDDSKTGSSGLQETYIAADKTHCMVAFLSPGYIQSSQCNEEFNIVLARHYAQDSVLLIPVHTNALETVPRRFTSIPCIDMGSGTGEIALLAEKLADMVMRMKLRQSLCSALIFKQKLQERRAADFKRRFRLEGGQVVRNSTMSVEVKSGDVVYSFAEDCSKLAAIMCAVMKQRAPGLTCHLRPSNPTQRWGQLQSADLVVMFVSDLFISSLALLEELYMVLWRQRLEDQRTIAYFVQCDHGASTPFHLQALPFSVSLEDNLWRRLERASSNKSPRYMVDVDGVRGTFRCTVPQNLALTAAVQDILHLMPHRQGR
ncbi:uncharacterized protein LOC101860892 [Aplysia californica]|uniref:Uncharacterized protein LOC101860892 n=1 Tax=Aplysia californica TaxID=6500 RepID=A0ABM0JN75_APLCA|nr:uncharacterized protein LOC101860892 [Aplysia californica]